MNVRFHCFFVFFFFFFLFFCFCFFISYICKMSIKLNSTDASIAQLCKVNYWHQPIIANIEVKGQLSAENVEIIYYFQIFVLKTEKMV